MKLAAPTWLYFFRQYPRHTISILFFLTVAGLVESVGAVSVLPLLGGLFGKNPATAPLTEKIHQLFLDIGLFPSLGSILLVICAAMVSKALLTFLAYQQAGYVEADITTQLRSDLLDQLLRAKWSYFVSQPSGKLTFALSTESTQAGVALRCICQMLSQLFQALSYLAAGLYISWEVMLTGLVVGGIIFVIFRGLIAYVRKAGIRQMEALNSMTSFFTDALTGAKPLKVMAAEEKFLHCIRTLAERFKAAARQHVLGTSLLITIQEPLLTLMLAGGLYWSRGRFALDEAVLLTMAFFFHRLLSRLSAAQQSFQQYAFIEALLVSLLAKIEEVKRNRQPEDGGQKVELEKCIELRGVDFTYGAKPMLNNLSLTVPVGAVSVLTGPSGSGKTTITDLITGLTRPDRGTITIDGVAFESMNLRTWREQIGYVPQEVFLFNDTIRNNILIGRDLPDAAVWAALEMAGAKHFVEASPGGLDSIVGEQGRSLSGGQRQRLMIARAVVSRPRLLIMDEATSGLDRETAEEILTTVASLKQGMAVLIVSHQDTVRGMADHIYEIGVQPACEQIETNTTAQR
jgi:ATP-binding cassette, subfamily C, bacterial